MGVIFKLTEVEHKNLNISTIPSQIQISWTAMICYCISELTFIFEK